MVAGQKREGDEIAVRSAKAFVGEGVTERCHLEWVRVESDQTERYIGGGEVAAEVDLVDRLSARM